MREQKKKDISSNHDLMESLFKNKRVLKYEFSSDSPLYNTVSVLCDYMNIPLVAHQRRDTRSGTSAKNRVKSISIGQYSNLP